MNSLVLKFLALAQKVECKYKLGIARVQALADISRLALHAIIIGRFDYSQTVSRESGKTRRGFGPKHYEYSSVPNGTVPLNSHVSACST